jgi:hypothetical protein
MHACDLAGELSSFALGLACDVWKFTPTRRRWISKGKTTAAWNASLTSLHRSMGISSEAVILTHGLSFPFCTLGPTDRASRTVCCRVSHEETQAYVTSGPSPQEYRAERACLFLLLLAQLPNLVSMDIDVCGFYITNHEAVLHNVESRHGLRHLALIVKQERDYPGPLARVSKALSNLPDLVSFQLACTVDCFEEGHFPELLGTLSSMRHLNTLQLNGIMRVSKSWPIPVASGGLSNLSLDTCDFDVATLEAILAVHASDLKRLRLINVLPSFPTSTHELAELARGPKYEMNKLETLSVGFHSASEEYLRRFSSSPIQSLQVKLLFSVREIT